MYNLNVPIKAKDPPWFAVQMGSVADSVAANIRIIIDNTNFLARKITKKRNSFTYLYLIMLNQALNHTLPTKQSGFRDKSVIFVTSISIPEAPMGRGWADIYIVKGVSDAFVLTIRELRKLICQSRTKQQETSHGCIVYSPYWLRLHFAFVAKKGYLYTYTYVGLSALLVSD